MCRCISNTLVPLENGLQELSSKGYFSVWDYCVALLPVRQEQTLTRSYGRPMMDHSKDSTKVQTGEAMLFIELTERNGWGATCGSRTVSETAASLKPTPVWARDLERTAQWTDWRVSFPGSCWSESLSAVLTAHICLGRGELKCLTGFRAFELFIYPAEGAFLQDGMFHLPLEHPVS